MTVPALQLSGITKAYGDNVVLRGVDISVEAGEIHALLGENGAGKSTIIKILAGVEHRDAGEILVGTTPLPDPHLPDDVQRAGVAFVHQNLGLLDSLSVADNVGLYAGFTRTWRGIDRAASRRKALRFLEQVGDIVLDPDALVGTLTQDEKVLVAIARAFALDPRVIVLDEVSASLPAPEMDRLAKVLGQAKQRGVAYIYVTHRLNEVYDFADRVTILRDGYVALTGPVDEVSRDRAVEAIVGRPVQVAAGRPPAVFEADVVVTARGLLGTGLHEPISFEVRGGEVLGVCGLVGSGIRSLAQILGGATRPSAGEMHVDGIPVALGRPSAMNRAGCAYVPGQRGREGILPNLTVRENLFPLRKQRAAFSSFGWLDRREEMRRATAFAAELEVRPAAQVERAIRELSGGNQQKVVLGRALAGYPRLLVLEDPTAGVDVGSRRALHDLIRSAAGAGAAVVLISTDYDEIASESHRVLVMCEGVVVSEHRGEEVAAEHLAAVSHGAAPIGARPENNKKRS